MESVIAVTSAKTRHGTGSRRPGREDRSDPEVVDNVPGHVIPILEREFDDFDTESSAFLGGRARGGRVHRLPPPAGRLRAASGRAADDPREAPLRRRHPRAARGVRSVIERYVPLRKGHLTTRQNVQLHHVPLPDAAKLIREISRHRSVLARGLRQHDPQRHRRPVGRRLRGRAVRPDALCRRLRSLLRAPRGLPADAAQVQDRVHRDRRGHRDHAASTTPASCRGSRTASAASRSASAAAPRSCRASRRRSTSSSAPTTAST